MKNLFKLFLIAILVLIITTLFLLPNWTLNYFGVMNFDQVLFTLMNAQGGANSVPVIDYFNDTHKVYIFYVLIVFGYLYLISKFVVPGSKTYFQIRFLSLKATFSLFKSKRFYTVTLIIFSIILGVYSAYDTMSIGAYIDQIKNKSTIYEDYYVHPDTVDITFPVEKRNFIHIVLESMESTFSSYPLNGRSVNLIPNLSKLSNDNFTFESNNLSGYNSSPRFGQTISSLVGLTSGTPLIIPIGNNNYGKEGIFLPGVTTFGEILEDNGYNNYFFIGSDKSFAGRDTYFSTHGNYEIFDYTYAKDNSLIPEDYHVFWGFEDSKLINFSKDKLTEISKSDEPFNFTFLNVDSHFMDGYTDASCDTNYSIPYANALSCTDKQISEFVSWIQQQDFYANTTILITADHLTMNNEFGSKQPTRALYHTIINGTTSTDNIERNFVSADWFPTSLHLLGATIEGNRLGFGTNLFSNLETYTEIFGEEFYNETGQKSDYYTNKILQIKE